MTVVAEGVETVDQLKYLAKSNCDFAQGYLFSRPVPEKEALQFLYNVNRHTLWRKGLQRG